MIKNQENQAALASYIELASTLIKEHKQSSNLHQLQENTVFALGAQLMHVGQCLTELSGYKLEPPTLESKMVLSEIVRLLEMPTISLKEA